MLPVHFHGETGNEREGGRESFSIGPHIFSKDGDAVIFTLPLQSTRLNTHTRTQYHANNVKPSNSTSLAAAAGINIVYKYILRNASF